MHAWSSTESYSISCSLLRYHFLRGTALLLMGGGRLFRLFLRPVALLLLPQMMTVMDRRVQSVLFFSVFVLDFEVGIECAGMYGVSDECFWLEVSVGRHQCRPRHLAHQLCRRGHPEGMLLVSSLLDIRHSHLR